MKCDKNLKQPTFLIISKKLPDGYTSFISNKLITCSLINKLVMKKKSDHDLWNLKQTDRPSNSYIRPLRRGAEVMLS